MAKILVVDDEADLEVLIKQKFRQKIREHQYEFLFAINGVQALKQLEQNTDVDMVLSDINMPEMDGLTLLTKLNEQNGLLKSVIVSAYGDMDNIRVAMNRGGGDLLRGCIGKQIPRELFDGELIVRQVAVEGVDHPIAIRPDVQPEGIGAVAF